MSLFKSAIWINDYGEVGVSNQGFDGDIKLEKLGPGRSIEKPNLFLL